MKASAALIFLTFTGIFAVPVSKDDSLDNYIRQVLELFKSQMTTGIPDLGIPVLDPFAVTHFDIPEITEDIITATIKVDDLVIQGLSTFNTDDVHVDIESLSFNLQISIPLVRGDAMYDLDGVILSLFPLYGSGAMWLELDNLVVSATAGLTIDMEGYAQVQDLHLSADFSSIRIHLDNILGGGQFGDAINALLSALGATIWDLVDDIIFDLVDDALTTVINDALHKCSIQQIVDGTCEFKDLNDFSFNQPKPKLIM